MSPDAGTVIQDIQTLKFLPESERTEYYDSVIAPKIKKAAAEIHANPSLASVTKWLEIQSATLGFATEGITEVTYELSQDSPAELQRAILLLSAEQQIRIQMLLNEFRGEENLPSTIADSDAIRTNEFLKNTVAPLITASAAVSGVLGKFVGVSSFLSTRGFPVEHGTFTLSAPDGSINDTYTVNTGGGARTFRTTNGPVPPGIYRVSNHRGHRTDSGMLLNGIGYSFDLNPADGTQVYGRSLFRIHPDGNAQGTNGCLGVREDAARLRRCEQQIVDLLNRLGAFKVSVTY